jgi:hypothetical protein
VRLVQHRGGAEDGLFFEEAVLMRWIIQLLRTVTSRYPLNTSRASLLRLLPEIPEGFGEFVGKNGIRYKRYSVDAYEVSRSLFWFGDFDPWVNIALKKFSSPGLSPLILAPILVLPRLSWPRP